MTAPKDGAFTFDVIRSFDPVLWESNEPEVVANYAVERDISKLRFSDTAKPIIFRCRVLTREQRRLVEDQSSDDRKRHMAFRFGLVEVRDVPTDSGMTTSKTVDRQSAKDPLTPEALDMLEGLGLGDGDFTDIGAAIVARSFLAKGVQPRCVLPPFSVRACAHEYSKRPLVGQLKDSPMPKDEPDPSAPSSSDPASPSG